MNSLDITEGYGCNGEKCDRPQTSSPDIITQIIYPRRIRKCNFHYPLRLFYVIFSFPSSFCLSERNIHLFRGLKFYQLSSDNDAAFWGFSSQLQLVKCKIRRYSPNILQFQIHVYLIRTDAGHG